jgi:hypothetical protein
MPKQYQLDLPPQTVKLRRLRGKSLTKWICEAEERLGIDWLDMTREQQDEILEARLATRNYRLL